MRPVIEIDKEKCVRCHRCIAVCPTRMCNNSSGNYVSVNPDLCIGCGICIDACTHGARRGIDDTGSFFAALERGEKIVAVVSPAVTTAFENNYLNLNGWLVSKGVKAVFDESFGAELAGKACARYLQEKNPELLVSQTCPVLVSFIEIYRPELIPYVSPVGSPIHYMLQWIKDTYPEYADAKTAVISTCYAKRREFDDIRLGDYNVTLKSLQQYLSDNNINPADYSAVPYASPASGVGTGIVVSGGLTRIIEKYIPGIRNRARIIEGQPRIYSYLAHLSQAIRNGDAPVFQLVDCLNCDMGCVGGCGTMNTDAHQDRLEGCIERRIAGRTGDAAAGKKYVFRHLPVKRETGKVKLYTRTYTDCSEQFHTTIHPVGPDEIKAVFRKMRKTEPKHILNCGSCGYKNCEQMAVAISNGLNVIENCAAYMQQMVQAMHQSHQDEITSTISLTVSSISEKVKTTGEHVQALTDIINSMATCVSQSSASIEEMVANVESIKHVLDNNTKVVEDLAVASRRGQEGMDGVASMIAEIKTHSRGLADTNAVIRNISSQTRLLSMNAAIEAAHAGSAGRGFSVVAEEIRKLAENSGGQAKKITRVLKNIKKLIDTTAVSSGDAQTLFAQVVQLSEQVKQQELVIQHAVTEQADGGTELLSALQQMNLLMQRVKDNSDELEALSAKVIEEITALG